ncbi:MAG: PAS domain-containing protein [Coriobacteriales bacterium]|nr:PAS domain-containing protein [Coriobacteriales bacterium]
MISIGTLTGRIFRSIFLIAIVVVLFAGVLVSGLVYSLFDNQLRRELLNTAELIESSLPTLSAGTLDSALSSQFDPDEAAAATQSLVGDKLAYLEGLELRELRVTWIAADGRVLYDSAASEGAELENHLSRPEVQLALRDGSGFANRHSATLDENTVYLARLLPDGSILRVAGTQKSILGHMLAALGPVILILAAVAILAAASARLMARRILGPLESIDFEEPLMSDTYPELAPLLTRLNTARHEIAERTAQLDAQREEFSVVTGSMREGLVLVDSRDQVLFINEAAAQVFEVTPADVLGRHLLVLDRNSRMQHVVAAARENVGAEGTIERDGRVYQLRASPVIAEGDAGGVALLVLDITEWYQTDAQRREFTANVSHELKTPLTVINGYAELMERGMVEPADAERFMRLIHEEATRLITLVDDIITLSQLDESESSALVPPVFEPVDLAELAQEVCGRLASFAQGREIDLVLDTAAAEGTATVEGVPVLLSKMLYNLVENGIRYTDPGGKVAVSIAEAKGESVVLRVSDTGIGIPAALHDKVFERFFCVDHSRSRDTGGTGLGLAIVKHAAVLHQADVTLTSAEAKGTTVEVRFPHP